MPSRSLLESEKTELLLLPPVAASHNPLEPLEAVNQMKSAHFNPGLVQLLVLCLLHNTFGITLALHFFALLIIKTSQPNPFIILQRSFPCTDSMEISWAHEVIENPMHFSQQPDKSRIEVEN